MVKLVNTRGEKGRLGYFSDKTGVNRVFQVHRRWGEYDLKVNSRGEYDLLDTGKGLIGFLSLHDFINR